MSGGSQSDMDVPVVFDKSSIMDVGSILIGSVIDFIFLKDFIESVIKKKYLQMAVCGIFLLSTTVEYFRIVLK